ILARFSDQTTTYSQAAFDSLFNDTGYTTGGAVGSVKDFYKEISYNSLTVQTTVSQWVTLPHTFAYYGANAAGGDARPREMVLDAIQALDADGFDFSAADGNADGEVDGLDIIHSGRGEEYGGNNSDYIWSHMWALSVSTTVDGVSMQTYHTEPELRGFDTDASSEIARIGVICHETGHFLGLPDLYDTTYASSGAGDFCLMASGSWNGVSSADGSSPAHMSAWCKKYLGWASPTQITMTGSYSLPRAEDSSTAMYLFKGAGFSAQEYFLAENRQGFGFDAGLPGTSRGMLIWHVDESKLGSGDNDDPTHYLVDLMEAGGTQDLELAPNVGGDDSDY
ncbi:MAG TPA: M6 family metalloprotease domain-containing protein, partial [Elusimicrobiales bacterium]|nr:M6 family metalloprotease domain-containing protein [Elusimicrobiales bacterium]